MLNFTYFLLLNLTLGLLPTSFNSIPHCTKNICENKDYSQILAFSRVSLSTSCQHPMPFKRNKIAEFHFKECCKTNMAFKVLLSGTLIAKTFILLRYYLPKNAMNYELVNVRRNSINNVQILRATDQVT